MKIKKGLFYKEFEFNPEELNYLANNVLTYISHPIFNMISKEIVETYIESMLKINKIKEEYDRTKSNKK